MRLQSAVEQAAVFLRQELRHRRWTGRMPGVDQLARELGVSRKTSEAALKLLESEGLLKGQGPRRRRRIEAPAVGSPPALRIFILLHADLDRNISYLIELLHELVEAGHAARFAEKSMQGLGMDVKRIARFVQQTGADAWLVIAGSREVLQWFEAQPLPVFALFGRFRSLPVAAAGLDKRTACAAATRALIGLGHRRIVLLCRRPLRQPEPGDMARGFLGELKEHGIPAGGYNLPEWEETPAGLALCLEALFLVTPPTAVIADQVPFFMAVLQFLSRRRLRVPEDVSLVSTDADPAFSFCAPSVAHIAWDSRPLVRSIVRWASHVGSQRKDLRQQVTKAIFITGGTIGPSV
jgi:DNA-binding LacI/PurR family transcriptional regulator